jgi:uncharacterized membrane-anchored protein
MELSMSDNPTSTQHSNTPANLLNKVPEITLYFWIIKILCTTVGETASIFAGLIALAALAHWRFRLNAIFAFWFAYVLTRPLGASIGDYMSQPQSQGALGLGTVVTSALFLTSILGLVTYLAITRKDVSTAPLQSA